MRDYEHSNEQPSPALSSCTPHPVACRFCHAHLVARMVTCTLDHPTRCDSTSGESQSIAREPRRDASTAHSLDTQEGLQIPDLLLQRLRPTERIPFLLFRGGGIFVCLDVHG
mmetsp:Transcript_13615/g.35704  ORF Transcript_13615/g.35704 Transcript_13615/m.35704 type:complete len:112 (-) Transcript_13615:571-906(-)